MKESENRKPLSEIATSRRAFFGTIAALAVGASVYEYEKLRKDWDGIETRDGIFFPLYEDHTHKIKNQQLPANIDVFFKETGALESLDDAEVEAFQTDPKKSGEALSIPPDVTTSLAKNGTEIMFGDVKIPLLEAYGALSTNPAEAVLGGGIGTYLVLTSNKERKTTRRKLLRAGLGFVSLWGLSNTVLWGTGMFSNESVSSRRIAARINHMSQQLHPENITEYIRSLVWASKMLDRARVFREKNGRKARVAFNVGFAHGNVEGFLHAGKETCNKLLLSYPAPLLKSIVNANGGIEPFAGYTLIQLPKDLDPNAADYEEKIQAASKQYLRDSSLKDGLKTRLKFVI